MYIFESSDLFLASLSSSCLSTRKPVAVATAHKIVTCLRRSGNLKENRYFFS
jgi:hypothetical protein